MSLDIPTILRLAKLAVDKCAQSNTQPGFVITQKGHKIKVRFTELSAALEDLSQQDLVAVKRCENCDNWYRSAFMGSGSCFPKDYTAGRSSKDFCSKHYVYRSPERKAIDDALSKKRAGNGT